MPKEGQKKEGSDWQNAAKRGAIGYVYFAGVLAPFTHPPNVVAATAAKAGVTSYDAARIVYQGQGNLAKNFAGNFFSGITDHAFKEIVRGAGKTGGLLGIKPWLEKNYTPFQAGLMFAGSMSLMEMLIANPADMLKARRAVGLPREISWELYRGAFGNGVRQFITWGGWDAAKKGITDPLLEHMEISPKSIPGLCIASPIQAAVSTFGSYPVEIVTRSHQINGKHPMQSPADVIGTILRGKKPGSSYMETARNIISEGAGTRALWNGVSAKFINVLFLTIGSNTAVDVTNWVDRQTGGATRGRAIN